MRFSIYAQWTWPNSEKVWEYTYLPNENGVKNPGSVTQVLMIPNDVGPNQWNTDDE